MGNEEHYPAMPFNHGKKFFLIVIFHATAKLLERHTQHLHLLQHIVADVTVELALYLPQAPLPDFSGNALRRLLRTTLRR